MYGTIQTLEIKKTFTHFEEPFHVVKDGCRFPYTVIHGPTHGAVNGYHKTIKEAIAKTIEELDKLGKEGFRNRLMVHAGLVLKAKQDKRTARYNRRIDKVLLARMKAEKAHHTHACSLDIIKRYAVKLRNGKTMYPSQRDVYEMVIRPHQEAIRENPGIKWGAYCAAQWAKARREYASTKGE